jgi:hypothetical protein
MASPINNNSSVTPSNSVDITQFVEAMAQSTTTTLQQQILLQQQQQQQVKNEVNVSNQAGRRNLTQVNNKI